MAGRSEPEIAAARTAMLADIQTHIREFGTGDGGNTLDPAVLEAMAKVPREAFVPAMERAHAYANRPLPIGHRQTISQPLIVALMTHHLRVEPASRVLEVGTGSGYQTAVLAELTDAIVTIENVAPLAATAKATLLKLGHGTIRFVVGDGRQGCPAHAPYDRIIVTAAADRLPEPLIQQLAPGGRLVAPVGKSRHQDLLLMIRGADGRIERRTLFPVAFVPLTEGLKDD